MKHHVAELEHGTCGFCGAEMRFDNVNKITHHAVPACRQYLELCRAGGAAELGPTVHVDVTTTRRRRPE